MRSKGRATWAGRKQEFGEQEGKVVDKILKQSRCRICDNGFFYTAFPE